MRARTLILALTLAFATACGGADTAPPVPSKLVANSSMTLSATVDQQVTERPSVKVLDASGAPIGGVAVHFGAAAGHGIATSVDQVTNESGVATIGTWQLDSIAGVNTLTVTAGGLPAVVFTAIGVAGPPRYLGEVPNLVVRAPVASRLTSGIGLVVKDKFMNPVAGVPFTFSVNAGGGTITGASGVSDAAGVVAPGSWTLGTQAGLNSLAAAVPGYIPLTVYVTATPGPAVALSRNSIDTASTIVGRSLGFAAAGAVDEYGNYVAGVPVTFAVTAGNGSITGGPVLTNEYGFAVGLNWSAGTKAGINTVLATSGSLRPVTFTGIGTPETPATVEKLGGDGQTGTVGTTLPIALSMVVKDKFGNTISDTQTYFVSLTGGRATPTYVQTDASGIATFHWTLTSAAGAQTLEAGIAAAAVIFSATATP